MDGTVARRYQRFTTGPNADGYALDSIDIDFHTIARTSTAGDQLKVTLYRGYSGNPGTRLCTLSDPSSFTSSGLQNFDAPTRVPCPVLAANTAYYVGVERVATTSDAISLNATLSDDEDPGSPEDSFANTSKYLAGRRDFPTDPESRALMIRVSGREYASSVRLPAQDFTVLAAGNDRPHGIWSDGTTMWVSQRHNPVAQTGGPAKIFAYDMASKAHKPTEDFNTLGDAGNDVPVGIWSDGTTMFVIDEQDRTIYAYDMATKQRDTDEEVWGRLPESSLDLWSDGDIMWVSRIPSVSGSEASLQAWDLDTGVRLRGRDFTGFYANKNNQPWASGRTGRTSSSPT